MEQERKAGFLQRFYIACCRPSRYKEILSAGRARHIFYVCCVIFLMVLTDTIIPFAAWDVNMGGLKKLITRSIPAFTVENGRMTIEEPVEFDIGGIVHLKADSDVASYNKSDLDERYQEEFLISSGNLVVRMADRLMEFSMEDITKDLAGEKLDNAVLAEAVPFFRMVLAVYFLSTYLVKGIEYMIAAVFFAVLCRAAIRTPDGKYVNLRGTLVIALYAKTLFSLLHSAHLCLGSPFGETLVLILGTIGTIIYIDRAEASVLNISRKI